MKPLDNTPYSPVVAIIGAGLSGLSCAQQLLNDGIRVHLFEKNNSPSGRIATLELPEETKNQSLVFDHGAQYFTARSPEFLQQVKQWEAKEKVQQWKGPFVSLTAGKVGPAHGNDPRYVGIPTMNSFGNDLAEELFSSQSKSSQLTLGAKVFPLKKSNEHWSIEYENVVSEKTHRCETNFDAVVLAVPSNDAIALLPEHSELKTVAAEHTMAPCVAVLLSFEQSLDLPFGGVFVQESPLRWISNNSSMPQRTRLPEQWILHASSPWSEKHWEESDQSILDSLLKAFSDATAKEILPATIETVFRWEQAIPTNPSSEGCFISQKELLALCGDWCHDARVEGAFSSGLKAAHKIRDILLMSN